MDIDQRRPTACNYYNCNFNLKIPYSAVPAVNLRVVIFTGSLVCLYSVAIELVEGNAESGKQLGTFTAGIAIA